MKYFTLVGGSPTGKINLWPLLPRKHDLHNSRMQLSCAVCYSMIMNPRQRPNYMDRNKRTDPIRCHNLWDVRSKKTECSTEKWDTMPTHFRNAAQKANQHETTPGIKKMLKNRKNHPWLCRNSASRAVIPAVILTLIPQLLNHVSIYVVARDLRVSLRFAIYL